MVDTPTEVFVLVKGKKLQRYIFYCLTHFHYSGYFSLTIKYIANDHGMDIQLRMQRTTNLINSENTGATLE